MEVRGTVCLVTGASSGIGRATADALAAVGADVLRSGLEHADLSLPGAGTRLAAETLAQRGRVDVLVNCAGVGHYGRADESDAPRLFAVNVLAPIELTQALLPEMRERGTGHIVNVGSIVGHVGRPNEAVYAATKAALAIFTSSLRAELRGSGIGVSLVSPVAVDTAFFAERGAGYGRRWPRLVSPERVAAAIVRAIRDDRAELVVPRWLTLAVRVRAAAPGLYRALAARFD